MTEKQARIQEVALQLFARQGYAGTSTSKVAREAGVSEGLIFRHFDNKAGLLRAILAEGKARIRSYFGEIMLEPDPRELLRKTIDLPFDIVKKERDFWLLQKSLKFQRQAEYRDLDPGYREPMLRAAAKALAQLGYAEPEKEAQLLGVLLEGVSLGLLLGDIQEPEELKAFLREKYLT